MEKSITVLPEKFDRYKAQCAKCGEFGPRVEWHLPVGGLTRDACAQDVEHIHCECQRCGYQWGMLPYDT